MGLGPFGPFLLEACDSSFFYVPLANELLLFALIGWRVYASMGGMQNDIGSSEVGAGQTVTFQDVAGVDEARAELAET